MPTSPPCSASTRASHWTARSHISNPPSRRAHGGAGSRRRTHESAGTTPCALHLQETTAIDDRLHGYRCTETGCTVLAAERRWLERAGFAIGGKVKIDVSEGRLIIESVD